MWIQTKGDSSLSIASCGGVASYKSIVSCGETASFGDVTFYETLVAVLKILFRLST